MTNAPSRQCTEVPESRWYSRIALRALRLDRTDLTVEVQGSGFSFARLIFGDPVGI
jgi:hypothetical protein